MDLQVSGIFSFKISKMSSRPACFVEAFWKLVNFRFYHTEKNLPFLPKRLAILDTVETGLHHVLGEPQERPSQSSVVEVVAVW